MRERRGIELANPVAGLGPGDSGRLVHHHLRSPPQPGSLTRLHGDPEQWQVMQLARHRQDCNGGVFSVAVGLHDERRPRLPIVPRDDDRYQIAAFHTVQPSVSLTSSIQRITSASSLSGSAAWRFAVENARNRSRPSSH